MPHRVACLLLAAALVWSGASAPFAHVHAHGRERRTSPAHGGGPDAHCAHHRGGGAHWHLPEGAPAAERRGGAGRDAGSAHRSLPEGPAAGARGARLHRGAGSAHRRGPEGPATGAGRDLTTAGGRHRHAAVALSAAAVETPPVAVGAPAALVGPPGAGALPAPPFGAHVPVDPATGPDPPPRFVAGARAPPVRS